MPHYSSEDIVRARGMDLLTYLQANDPDNLVKVCTGTYCTREHDSLKISNGKWHWFSRGIGGKTALDYLIKVKGYSFQQGVEEIIERTVEIPSVPYVSDIHKPPAMLELPKRHEKSDNAEAYLRSRGICNELIRFCERSGRLYESAVKHGNREFHNAVFVGFDNTATPKYAYLRGLKSDFKGEAYGSDKRYSFSIPAEKESDTLHLFEAVIDLLSFATLKKLNGESWHSSHLLSLAGVYESKDPNSIPPPLEQYLCDHAEIRKVCLHLDNDGIGRAASNHIAKVLSDMYIVTDEPPKYGKDMNDELIYTIRKKYKEEKTR